MGRTSAEPAAPSQAAPALVAPFITAARARLADELARLPAWGAPAFWARVGDDGERLALGTLAALVAEAMRRAEAEAARRLFVRVLERIEGESQRWAARVAARTWGVDGPAARGALREDLCQELALRLWQRLALAPSEPWWLFFERALDYERRHTARDYMGRSGYWPRAGRQRLTLPTSSPTTLARLEMLLHRDDPQAEPVDARAERAHTAADLADLAAAVALLPGRERLAVVLRFWEGAPEAEIARALACTERTVRNLLRRAYVRLRAAYVEEGS